MGGVQDATTEADTLMAASFLTPDFHEGGQSFVEKRTPAFPSLRGDRDF